MTTYQKNLKSLLLFKNGGPSLGLHCRLSRIFKPIASLLVCGFRATHVGLSPYYCLFYVDIHLVDILSKNLHHSIFGSLYAVAADGNGF